MGEIADAIINGECCALCGQYFYTEPETIKEQKQFENGVFTSYEHGYPVACKECWDKNCGYEKAIANTI